MAKPSSVGKWNKPWRKGEMGIFYFCPVCGSTDVTWIGGLPILAPHMECKECGHRGVFILGDMETIKGIRKCYLEGKTEDHGNESDEEEE